MHDLFGRYTGTMAEAKKSQGPRSGSSLSAVDDEYETIYDPPEEKSKDKRATKTAYHLGTVNAVDEATEEYRKSVVYALAEEDEKVEEFRDSVTYSFAQGGIDSNGLAGGKSVQQINTFGSVDDGSAQHVNTNSSAGVSSVQQVNAFGSTGGGGSAEQVNTNSSAGGGSGQQVNTNSSAGGRASESQNDVKGSASQTSQGGGSIFKRMSAVLSRVISPRASSPSRQSDSSQQRQSDSSQQRQSTSANPVSTDNTGRVSMVTGRGSQTRAPTATLVSLGYMFPLSCFQFI